MFRALIFPFAYLSVEIRAALLRRYRGKDIDIWKIHRLRDYHLLTFVLVIYGERDILWH